MHMQSTEGTVNEAQVVSDEAIDAYKNVKNAFIDYARFEDTDADRRAEAKRRFIEDIDYVPVYTYPKLDTFNDDAGVAEKKTNIYEAVLEIEVARSAAEAVGDDARAAELLLYRMFHDLRLRKMELVAAAASLHNAHTSSAQETARSAYALLNAEVYGEIDRELYGSVLTDYINKTDSFTPSNEMSEKIAKELRQAINHIDRRDLHEESLLDDVDMKMLHNVVLERYEPILSVVPDTDTDVYYDAEQCAEIMNEALRAGDLAKLGWVCVVDKDKSNPSTHGVNRTISLPSTTRRTADELRRLIIHEQEVHARRSENGKASGSSILSSGTADYTDVEEGLGVILECAVMGNVSNPSFDRAKERYLAAGLIEGLDGSPPRDAREVYEILWRFIAVMDSEHGSIDEDLVTKAKNKSMAHIDNAFRSTNFWMKGVHYAKLKVYYEGLVKNAQYFKDNTHDLNRAFDRVTVGKVNHTDEDEMALVERILQS